MNLQRKPGCPCGGGCPKCQTEELKIQPKLRISQPNDPYEQEADAVAEPGQATGGGGGRRSLRDLARQAPLAKPVEDQDERDAERLAQQAMCRSAGEALPISSQNRGLAQGRALGSGVGGLALPAAIRGRMESRFNWDFSAVRIHDDERSAGQAQALESRAYTFGQDIIFGRGQYRPDGAKGQALLGHELAHVVQQQRSGQSRIQRARLRDWASDRTAAVSDADIETTSEYQSYMNPTLVWQTVHSATRDEAIQACRYILAALRNGVSITWSSDALSYLNRARDYLDLIQTLATDQQAWLTSEGAVAGLSVGEQIHDMAQTGGYGGNPATWWDGLAPADQATWMTDAAAVIARVEASVVGTRLEDLVNARGIVASPRRVEVLGVYAYYSSSDDRLHVGKSWIQKADHDPLDVHDNIAHELGGHFEYRQYGDTMGDRIMDAVLANLPPAERTLANAGPRSVYSAFAYLETELFAELREYDYRRPASGGDAPTVDIPRKLTAIHNRFALNVAQAIVTELSLRVHEANNISNVAKAYFDAQIPIVFGGWTP